MLNPTVTAIAMTTIFPARLELLPRAKAVPNDNRDGDELQSPNASLCQPVLQALPDHDPHIHGALHHDDVGERQRKEQWS